MGPQVKEHEQVLETGKVKEISSPQNLQEERSPANALILAQKNWLQISDLHTVR